LTRGGSLRNGLVLALLLAGCARKDKVSLDPTLPDGKAVAVGTPDEVLDEAASASDPTLRGIALYWRLVGVDAAELTRWVMQGTYDPEVWVQRQVADALLQRLDVSQVREMLGDYVGRAAGDPYVRGRVARGLAAASLPEASAIEGTWRRVETWKGAPLALAALQIGDAEAITVIGAALRSAEVRDDDEFFAAVGQSGMPDLAEAAAAGAALAEDATAVRLSLLRGLLGDGPGAKVWRDALRDADGRVQQDAVGLLLPLPPELRAQWAAEAKRASDKAAKEMAALFASPSGDRLVKAAKHDSAVVRRLVQVLARELTGAEAAPVVALGLRDDDHDVRRGALRIAALLGVTSERATIEALARDPRREVRVAAAGALLVLR
jgi:hypothetical protein